MLSYNKCFDRGGAVFAGMVRILKLNCGGEKNLLASNMRKRNLRQSLLALAPGLEKELKSP